MAVTDLLPLHSKYTRESGALCAVYRILRSKKAVWALVQGIAAGCFSG